MGRSFRGKGRQRRGKAPKEEMPDKRGEEKAVILPLVVIAVIAIVIGVSLYLHFLGKGSDGDGVDNSFSSGQGDQGTNGQTGPLYISLEDVNGGSLRLIDLKGKVVLLDLMATWCGPCKLQMEELRQLRDAYPSDGLVMLSVGVDLSESPSILRSFRDQERADWPFLRSVKGFNDAFPASSIPTLYLLDRTGSVAKTHVGVTGYDVLSREVATLTA